MKKPLVILTGPDGRRKDMHFPSVLQKPFGGEIISCRLHAGVPRHGHRLRQRPRTEEMGGSPATHLNRRPGAGRGVSTLS